MYWQTVKCIVLLALCSPQITMQSDEEATTKQIQASLAKFTVNLTRTLHQNAGEGENILFSPLNIYSALSLAHLAAAGSTKNEFAKVLGWRLNDNQTLIDLHHTTFGEMLKSLNADIKDRDPYTIVKLANGIFVDKKYPIKASFEQDLHKYYTEGNIEAVDYGAGSTATDTINKWASNATEGRIPQLFSQPITPDTIVMLATSLYFCGKWDESFGYSTTKSGKFNTGTSTVDVQMMNLVEFILYTNNKDLQFEAIIKPYAGRDYSMLFILPHESQTLKNLTSHLTVEELQKIVTESKSAGVDYKIPRTKFSMGKSLKPALTKQGLNQVFSSSNLTNMVDAPTKLSDVYHAAEIELDERGTKASAITAVQFVYLSAPLTPHDPIKFYLNRPFMLALYHHHTSTFLFIGLVNKPVA